VGHRIYRSERSVILREDESGRVMMMMDEERVIPGKLNRDQLTGRLSGSENFVGLYKTTSTKRKN